MMVTVFKTKTERLKPKIFERQLSRTSLKNLITMLLKICYNKYVLTQLTFTCSKPTVETRHCRRSGGFTVKFEHILHLF